MTRAAPDALMSVFGMQPCGFEVRVPQLLPPGPNAREHWAKKAARVKKERCAVALVLSQFERPALPVVVTLTRCGTRVMDGDNLVACMKAPIDSVAQWLGIDDADPRVTWRVEQRKVAKAERGTVIRIEAVNAGVRERGERR